MDARRAGLYYSLASFPAILEQGARFVRLLKETDVPAELAIVPGTHRSSIEDLDKPDNPTFRIVRDFIEHPAADTGAGDSEP